MYLYLFDFSHQFGLHRTELVKFIMDLITWERLP